MGIGLVRKLGQGFGGFKHLQCGPSIEPRPVPALILRSSEFLGSGRVRALPFGTGLGSGFAKQGFWAKISLSYYIKKSVKCDFQVSGFDGLG